MPDFTTEIQSGNETTQKLNTKLCLTSAENGLPMAGPAGLVLAPMLTSSLLHIQSPANPTAWEKALAKHPDQKFARYVLHRVPMQNKQLAKVTSNMPIADSEVVTDFIREKVKEGRLRYVLSGKAYSSDIHCSPIGIIPSKKLAQQIEANSRSDFYPQTLVGNQN